MKNKIDDVALVIMVLLIIAVFVWISILMITFILNVLNYTAHYYQDNETLRKLEIRVKKDQDIEILSETRLNGFKMLDEKCKDGYGSFSYDDYGNTIVTCK